MQATAIILLSVMSASAYGILHDQVTARVCVEYFTIGHPPVFDTDDPTLLGLGWGILATWWGGAILGVLLAIAACVGTRPRRNVAGLVRPILVLLLIMALSALAAGVLGWALAEFGVVYLVEPLTHQVPRERHVAFLANLWAHSASYLVGFGGGIVLIWHVWRSRDREAKP
jgi:cytochrome bd-type quinol oxidase subunit 1